MEYLIGGFVSLSATLVGLRFYNKRCVWGRYDDFFAGNNAQSRADIRDKTIIVTGASSGIGKEIARELYQNGGRIIMACRNADDCQSAINDIKSSSPSSCTRVGELIYKHLDLSSLESVREFVKQISREEATIHILVNNAAVYNDPPTITADGYERNMQINHLSSAYLTLSLLPKLNHPQDERISDEEGQNKIIFVTSTLYKKGNIFERFLQPFASTEELKSTEAFSSYCRNIYPNTKLANLMFANQLSHKKELLRGVNVSVASPGFALTRLHRNVPKSRLLLMSLLSPLLLPFLRSSRDGSQTIIGCALLKQTQPDILYRNCKSDLKLTFNDTTLPPKVYQWTIDSLEPYLQ